MTTKNTKSSWSAKMKDAYDKGGRVIEAITHTQVKHEPRNKTDPKPWTNGNFRYTGRECYLDDSIDACVDRDGEEYPEHLDGEIECGRCGAELA